MIFKNIIEEIDGITARDPAARSRWDVVFSYPSFHAMRFHRLAHFFWKHNWRFLGRFVSQWGRFWTGIEIHPAAKIGRCFFADHGMGVVIGETADIGDNVTLYHDVTLGGTAPAVDSRAQVNVKRHPTLQDNVIVGSGAQILGPITVRAGARVGANAVVVQDVPANATVVGIPARVVGGSSEVQAFIAYGTPCPELPDPIQHAVDDLVRTVRTLQARVGELENEIEALRGEPVVGEIAKLQAANERGA